MELMLKSPNSLSPHDEWGGNCIKMADGNIPKTNFSRAGESRTPALTDGVEPE
jgi:hypothetical protein